MWILAHLKENSPVKSIQHLHWTLDLVLHNKFKLWKKTKKKESQDNTFVCRNKQRKENYNHTTINCVVADRKYYHIMIHLRLSINKIYEFMVD